MDNRPIGVLDSGIGGLSIWKEIVKLLPHEPTVYLADSLNCPYGSKSCEEILNLSQRLIEFLFTKKNVKMVVIACNTITVSCIDSLRKNYPKLPIVGTVPVVKMCAALSKNKKIGILSTSATAKSVYQKNLIKKFASGFEVLNIGNDSLVSLIEKGELDGEQVQQILKKDLKKFVDAKVDTVALGCSHFPLVKNQIEEILGKDVRVLDSSGAIARQVKRVFKNNSQTSNLVKPTHIIYTTGSEKKLEQVMKKVIENEFLDRIEKVEYINI